MWTSAPVILKGYSAAQYQTKYSKYIHYIFKKKQQGILKASRPEIYKVDPSYKTSITTRYYKLLITLYHLITPGIINNPNTITIHVFYNINCYTIFLPNRKHINIFYIITIEITLY